MWVIRPLGGECAVPWARNMVKNDPTPTSTGGLAAVVGWFNYK